MRNDFVPVPALVEDVVVETPTIKTFGLIIAGRQEGPFRLELESIAAYGEPPHAAAPPPRS